LKHWTFISCQHFSALLISGCQNSGHAQTRFEFSDAVWSDANQRRPTARRVKRRIFVGGKRNRWRTDAADKSSQKSQEIPRFFHVVSTYNRTVDLILIRAVVFWRPRANRGPSMIHTRRHESGVSPSRASRSGPAVSYFFLTHFLAFWPSLSFLSRPCLRHLSPPSSLFSLPLIVGFPQRVEERRMKRWPRPSSSSLFFLLPCLLLFSFFYLTPTFFYLRCAFSCLANGEEPKEL